MKKIVIMLALTAVIFIIIFFIIICIFIYISNNSVTVSDWLAFTGSFLGFIGTIFLGIITLYQNHQLNKYNLKLQKQLLILEYRPQIKIIGYEISDSLEGIETINETNFYSKRAARAIQNCDIEKDVFSVLNIELKIKNLNPKSHIKHIGFYDFVQIVNPSCNICFDCPSIYLPVSCSSQIYSVIISCVCHKCKFIEETEEYKSIAQNIVNKIKEQPLIFQARMDIENYEKIHQQVHIDFIIDKKKDNRISNQVTETDIKYF